MALDFGILYQGSIDSMIAEHIDLNWVGWVDTRKSETGYVFTLGLGRQFHGNVSYQHTLLEIMNNKHAMWISQCCVYPLLTERRKAGEADIEILFVM